MKDLKFQFVLLMKAIGVFFLTVFGVLFVAFLANFVVPRLAEIIAGVSVFVGIFSMIGFFNEKWKERQKQTAAMTEKQSESRDV